VKQPLTGNEEILSEIISQALKLEASKPQPNYQRGYRWQETESHVDRVARGEFPLA
jgi:hypothetical protein